MIENLVGAWLTDASERSYEAAFAQLLVIEGFNVIQGPMHHAHEHGKDIIAWDGDGALCVFQLKGGSEQLDTKAVESVQDQLFAAAATAVTHPSLDGKQVPAKVFLVTNQIATGPAQSRVRALSEGNEARNMAPLRLVEHSELVSRFCRAQGRFFPTSPKGLNTFLSLFLANGRGPLPRREFFQLLAEVMPLEGPRPRANDAQRVVSAVAVTTAFALRRWLDCENHAEAAMGWICYCSQVLRLAERTGLAERRWMGSYRLGLEEARRHGRALLREALEADDLLIPNPAEPLLYSPRALTTCGLVAATVLSELIDHAGVGNELLPASQLLLRERPYLKVLGESQAPQYLLAALALEQTGEYRHATGMLLSWVRSVAQSNAPHAQTPLPDPYHSVEEILVSNLSFAEDTLGDEDFDGSAYTLHLAVRWTARRLWRQFLNSVWPAVTRIQHHEFEPDRPIDYLAPYSASGSLRSWFYPTPTSWATLLQEANERDRAALPKVLVKRAEFVPYFCLALPHRFTSRVADLLDDAVGGDRFGAR